MRVENENVLKEKAGKGRQKKSKKLEKNRGYVEESSRNAKLGTHRRQKARSTVKGKKVDGGRKRLKSKEWREHDQKKEKQRRAIKSAKAEGGVLLHGQGDSGPGFAHKRSGYQGEKEGEPSLQARVRSM